MSVRIILPSNVYTQANRLTKASITDEGSLELDFPLSEPTVSLEPVETRALYQFLKEYFEKDCV